MEFKSAGNLIIGFGVIVIFSMFAFCDWRPELDFMSNLRHAVLIETDQVSTDIGTMEGLARKVARIHGGARQGITLAQGLIIPILMVGLGLVLRYEVIDYAQWRRAINFIKRS
jgi:hypothetical protein